MHGDGSSYYSLVVFGKVVGCLVLFSHEIVCLEVKANFLKVKEYYFGIINKVNFYDNMGF